MKRKSEVLEMTLNELKTAGATNVEIYTTIISNYGLTI